MDPCPRCGASFEAEPSGTVPTECFECGRLDLSSTKWSLLARMFDSPNLSNLRDVVFVVEGEQFPAHRVVVAASSPVFEAMFTNGFRESSSAEVVLEGIERNAWGKVLQYMYLGKIVVCDNNDALSLLRIAHKYELSVLLDFLEQYLLECLSSDSLCERFVLADKLNLEGLRFEAKRRIEEEFFEVCENDSFHCLPYHAAEELFKSDELVVRSEMTVFNAIVSWSSVTSEKLETFNESVEVGNLDNILTTEDDSLNDRKELADDLILQYVDISQLTPSELYQLREHLESGVCVRLVGKVMDVLLQRTCEVLTNAHVVDSRLSLGAVRRNTAKLSLSHRLYMAAPDEKLSTTDPRARFSPWKCDSSNRRLWRLRYILNDGNDVEGPALGVSLMMSNACDDRTVRVTVRFQIGLFQQNGDAHHLKTSTETEFCTDPGGVAMWGWNEFMSWKEVCRNFKTEAPETLLFGANLLFVDHSDMHQGEGLNRVTLSTDVVL